MPTCINCFVYYAHDACVSFIDLDDNDYICRSCLPISIFVFSCSTNKLTCDFLNPIARAMLHFSTNAMSTYALQKSCIHTELAIFFSELKRFSIPFATTKSYADFPISDIVSPRNSIKSKNILK